MILFNKQNKRQFLNEVVTKKYKEHKNLILLQLNIALIRPAIAFTIKAVSAMM